VWKPVEVAVLLAAVADTGASRSSNARSRPTASGDAVSH